MNLVFVGEAEDVVGVEGDGPLLLVVVDRQRVETSVKVLGVKSSGDVRNRIGVTTLNVISRQN